jgi:hypothetical protein
MADDKLMTLAHAHDALGDQVTRFHNDMLHEGTKELTPREWALRFKSWFNEYDFERDYIATIKWIEDCERRERASSLPESPEAR